MQQTLPPICLIEPLSLIGRELLQLLDEQGFTPERVHALHVGEEDEHQVADIGGEPALVAPLTETEQVPEGHLVLIAGVPSPLRRPILRAVIEERTDQPILDLSGSGLIKEPVFSGPPTGKLWPPRAAVASPGSTIVAQLAGPLVGLGLEAVSAVVEVPASARGREAVEALAQNAAARLQGMPADGGPEDGLVAFDLTAGKVGRSPEEVALLLPGVETAIAEVRTGVFHGWAVHLGLRFSDRVHPDRIIGLWDASDAVDRFESGLFLSRVVETDRIHTGPLTMSSGGRQVTVSAAADGLRVGGAATALEILPALI